MYGPPHRHRIRITRLLVLVCALAVAATGCGGNASSSSTTHAPSGGVAGRDGGFTTVIPAGFVNGLAALSGGPVTLQYVALAPKVEGFRANINVVREPAHGLGDVGTVAEREIVGVKTVAPRAHRFSTIRTLTLDRAAARGVDYLNRPAGGPPLHQYQVYALHNNLAYTVTYTALSSRYRSSLPAMQQVLAAWRWK